MFLNLFKEKNIILLIMIMLWIPISSLFINYKFWIRGSAILICIAMTIALYVIYKANKSFFTLTSLFIILLNIFHFGNLFILMINPYYKFMVLDFTNRFTDIRNVVAAINFCVLTTLFIYLGMFFPVVLKKTKTRWFDSYKLSTKQLKIFAFLIILLTFPIQLYSDFNKLILAFSSGYLATYNFSLSGVFIQISAFYIIGFIILMIINKDNRKSTFIYLFIMLYQAINMFSGNRAKQVLSMLIVSFIYFILMKKLSLSKRNYKKFLLLVLSCYILMNCIINISSLRVNIGSDPIGFIYSCFIPQKNILVAIFDEFGYTLYTVVLEMDRLTHFSKGLTYVGSLITIFPTIFPVQREIIDFSNFVINLNYGGIGGSIIGELFYNFSWIGCIIGVFIGILVNWVSSLFTSAFKQRNYFLFSFFILPASSLLWWIRDSFLNIPRMITYEFFFLFVVYYLTKYITDKRENS